MNTEILTLKTEITFSPLNNSDNTNHIYYIYHACSVANGARDLLLSHVSLFATPCNVACQAPWPTGFFKQVYWSRLPFFHPGDLPDPGIKPVCLSLLRWQAGSSPAKPPGKPRCQHLTIIVNGAYL